MNKINKSDTHTLSPLHEAEEKTLFDHKLIDQSFDQDTLQSITELQDNYSILSYLDPSLDTNAVSSWPKHYEPHSIPLSLSSSESNKNDKQDNILSNITDSHLPYSRYHRLDLVSTMSSSMDSSSPNSSSSIQDNFFQNMVNKLIFDINKPDSHTFSSSFSFLCNLLPLLNQPLLSIALQHLIPSWIEACHNPEFEIFQTSCQVIPLMLPFIPKKDILLQIWPQFSSNFWNSSKVIITDLVNITICFVKYLDIMDIVVPLLPLLQKISPIRNILFQLFSSIPISLFSRNLIHDILNALIECWKQYHITLQEIYSYSQIFIYLQHIPGFSEFLIKLFTNIYSLFLSPDTVEVTLEIIINLNDLFILYVPSSSLLSLHSIIWQKLTESSSQSSHTQLLLLKAFKPLYFHLNDIPTNLPLTTNQESTMSLPRTDSSINFQILPDEVRWNQRFQSALDLSENSEEESLCKYRLLSMLSVDFSHIASHYGKLIISELCLPPEQRTIKPIIGLGYMGGEKYIVNNDILFKLARDVTRPNWKGHYLYGGNDRCDEYAQKAAANELRAASVYFSSQDQLISQEGLDFPSFERICVPMQAIVDYRGYRVLSMPLLPIGNSPVYGSCDAAITVSTSDSAFNNTMAILAQHLHLSPHKVQNHIIHSAVDVEGHIGSDNRRYLLDLARAMPPESPQATKHLLSSNSSIFYRLLRPEYLMFLKKYNLCPPLSSDAFSTFGIDENQIHNTRVHEATLFLINNVIPTFARKLQNFIDNSSNEVIQSLYDGQLVVELHKNGINCRHMGLLRSYMDPSSKASRLLLIEMTSRICKNLLRSALRKEIEHKQPSAYLLNQQVIRFLNLISGAHKDSNIYWNNTILPILHEHFGTCAFNLEIEMKSKKSHKNESVNKKTKFTKKRTPEKKNEKFRSKEDLNSNSKILKPYYNDDIWGQSPKLTSSPVPDLDNFSLDSQPIDLNVSSPAGLYLKNSVKSGLLHIIQYCLSMVGKTLTRKCALDCANRMNNFEFTIADVIESEARVKVIPFLYFVQGKLLQAQAFQHIFTDGSITHRLLSLSFDLFVKALQAEPSSIIYRTQHDLVHHISKIIESNLKSECLYNPLLYACMQEQYDAVNEMLSHHININVADEDGRTPLFWAVRRHNFKIVELLLKNNAKTECKLKKNSTTPLLYAVRKNDIKIVKLLLSYNANPTILSANKETPLTIAVQNGNFEMVKLLLSQPSIQIDLVDQYNQSAFDWAKKLYEESIKNKDSSRDDIFLKNIFDILSSAIAPRYQLIEAAKYGDLSLVHSIVSCKNPIIPINLNCADENGKTPFYHSVENNNFSVAKYLLDHGVDTEKAPASGNTPLMIICGGNKINLDLLKYILKFKPQTEVRNHEEYTPLMLMSRAGLYEGVEILSKVANIESKDREGYTSLFIACIFGHTQCVQILINQRANSNIVNNYQMTPLIRCCQQKNIASNTSYHIARLLLEGGANPNFKNKKGNCPLYYSIIKKDLEMIKLLLQYHADPHLLDNKQKTPIQYADDSIVSFIQDILNSTQ